MDRPERHGYARSSIPYEALGQGRRAPTCSDGHGHLERPHSRYAVCLEELEAELVKEGVSRRPEESLGVRQESETLPAKTQPGIVGLIRLKLYGRTQTEQGGSQGDADKDPRSHRGHVRRIRSQRPKRHELYGGECFIGSQGRSMGSALRPQMIQTNDRGVSG